MPRLKVNGVAIDDTFAEAFGMRATALVVTAPNRKWARQAAISMTGFATSVIGCGCEAAIDVELAPSQTPDGRPGCRVMIFAVSTDELQRQLQNRVGQCVLTSPGSACFAGLAGPTALKLGAALRYFGDGWQIAKNVDGRRIWRIPVMEGEFVCDRESGTTSGVGGGNILILATSRGEALAAAEAAVDAMEKVEGCILPFPGGVVRSGSKVGSKYKGMFASTNNFYCPTLRAQTQTQLPPEVASVMEIVIDGVSPEAVSACTRAGIEAVVALGRAKGVVAIDAGNYGGNLGPFHFKLREIMA